jgi:hypothetical protein
MRILSATAPPIPVYRCWIPKAFSQAAMPYHDVTKLCFTLAALFLVYNIHVQLNNPILLKNICSHIGFKCPCGEVRQIIYVRLDKWLFENQRTVTYASTVPIFSLPFFIYLKQNWLSFLWCFCNQFSSYFSMFTFVTCEKGTTISEFFTGEFLGFFVIYFIQHCFICRPSDSTVSEDAGTEPRTLALAVRRSNLSARSQFPNFY